MMKRIKQKLVRLFGKDKKDAVNMVKFFNTKEPGKNTVGDKLQWSFGSLFSRSNKRKEKIIELLSVKEPAAAKYTLDVNDIFVEQSATVISQVKKMRLSFLEAVDNVITSLFPRSIFVIEMLSDVVTVSIVSKQGVFLDIKYLKSYTYDELHIVHKRITGVEAEMDHTWYESPENVITIVSYETIYALPSQIVIIQDAYCDFYKVSIQSSRFKDETMLNSAINKEIEAISGYGMSDVYATISPFRTGEKDRMHKLVSICEKEAYDRIESYMDASDISIKKFHSVKSSLFSSSYTDDNASHFRIHVIGANAYTMYQNEDGSFDYQQFNLHYDYEALMALAANAPETVLSGGGDFYKKMKIEFLAGGVHIRTYNYNKDLPNCISRLERDISLDNSYVTVVSIAYHELFKINFKAIRLGVSKHLSSYEQLHKNTSVLPFFVIAAIAGLTYAGQWYLEYKLDNIIKEHQHVTEKNEQKKRLEAANKRIKSNIAALNSKVANMQNLIDAKKVSQEAKSLHMIANGLPDDMVLTNIEKKAPVANTDTNTVITVSGRCIYESSLLKYIRALSLQGKKVFLKSLTDNKGKNKMPAADKSQRTTYQLAASNGAPNAQGSMRELFEYPQNKTRTLPLNDRDSAKDEPSRLEESNRADTNDRQKLLESNFNNEFVLEIL
ncbi:MAG: hypothetical protein JXQ77_06030 [Campylobacterales bacterium]|nr:hypothetical protein [Campylobacterales bacterium]